MDTAIKAEWYDLDDGEREDFLGWYHAEYLPTLQAAAGHIWVGHYERAPETGASHVTARHRGSMSTIPMSPPDRSS